ncbi:MAG TPA: AMP-binding protein [Polyangiaceae bacterium]|nr:AMP-binding protein [Polyangiaceae bacterium]
MATSAPGSVPATFVQVLQARAEGQPDRVAYTFLHEGEVEAKSLTFGELHQAALAIAHRLSWLGARGERALLLYPQGLEFISAFFGCLYAGVIAVPVSLPSRKRGFEGLRRVAADAGAKWLLSTGDLLQQITRELAETPSAYAPTFLDTEACAVTGVSQPTTLPRVGPEELALLQYTSGSTGAPRGVAVTHGNLVQNQIQIDEIFRHDPDRCAVSWLPMFHDMGLGTVLQTLRLGARCVLMSPQSFLQSPVRWLRAISQYRAASSGGPDFAYDLCVRRIRPEERAGLDLSCWRVAYNGSEPVRAATLQRFAEAFASTGFRFEAFHPVYGLAEGTLIVTGEPASQPPVLEHFDARELELGRAVKSSKESSSLVGCGHAWAGTELCIVDPESLHSCAPGRVGEIWVRGVSVAQGYWGKPRESRETFGATRADGEGPFLRTGDLGFVLDDRLFVTGRRKDLIIIRGRNHYPHDLESSVSTSHPDLVPHACAAFSIETNQGEQLVVVQEVARTALRTLDAAAVVRAIRRAVSEQHALHTHAIVLLKPSTLPRTTSGKVRRKACREAFLSNALPSVVAWTSPLPQDAAAHADGERQARAVKADALIDWLRRHAADLINAYSNAPRSSTPSALLRDLAKQGLLGMQVEPEYGGLGLGNVDTMRVLEQLAAIDFALALFVGLNNYLGIQPIAKYARVQVKSLLLPGLAHGQEIAGFAFEEPTGRTPPGGVGMQAQAEGEDAWRLFGTKYLDGFAQGANIVNVFAHHDEPPGISAFVVSSGLDGLRHVNDGLSMGLLGFARDTVVLDGVLVGRESLLGNFGSGLDIAREAMMQTRLAIAAACIGGMKRCAQLAGRETPLHGGINGRLTPNPITLSRLGSVTASITALECLVRRVAQATDQGFAVPPEAFAACKVLGPDLLLRCIDDVMRVGAGGEPYRLSALHRDAGLLRNFDGPPEALSELTGAVVMAGDTTLRQLVEEVFGAPTLTRSIDTALDAVRQRMKNLSGALARRAQRWGHTRAGELTSWIVLLAAVDGARKLEPSPDLERAYAWADAQFQQALSAVRLGTPSETAMLDYSDVAATFAAYASTIGELHPDPRAEPDVYRIGAWKRPPESEPLPSVAPTSEATAAREPALRELKGWVVSWLARHLQIPVADVETGRSFADHGLDSIAAVELAKALSDRVGRKLDETVLWNFSTIDALVEHLVGPPRVSRSEPPPPPPPVTPNFEAERPSASLPVEVRLDDEMARLERELRSRS